MSTTYLAAYNAANPVRKQDTVSPAHAFLRQATWPRNYQLLLFLHQNPGATRRGICDFMKWPLWKVHGHFAKMSRYGLITRRNVGSRLYRYYLTREASLIARTVVEIEAILDPTGRARDQGEE